MQTELEVGDEVEWLTRPVGGGYLHGFVVQVGSSRVKIRVLSSTGQLVEKWANAQYLRRVSGEQETCSSCKHPFPDERRCTDRDTGKPTLCYACYVSQDD